MTELDPGTSVGHFTIEGVLGRGGMGVVYRARDTRLDRPVALKVVSPHLAESADYRQRFITEARAAASIDHRGIVPVFEVDDVDGVLYIAMRLVDGADLAAYAALHRPLSVEQALRLLAPVAEALDAAAKRGLVHRDVKPSNILISSPEAVAPEVLLSDFGLAKTQGAAGVTQTGQFVGSVDYVAPEMIAAGDINGRADQYALACVLFELLAGEPPYRRDQPMQTLFAQVNDPVPSLHAVREDIPEAVDSALGQALAKNRDQRYPSSAAFLNAVAAAAGIAPIAHESSTSLPVVPANAGHAENISRPTVASKSRRTPVLIGVAAVVALAIVGVGVLLLGGGGDGSVASSSTAPDTVAAATTDTGPSQADQQEALRRAYDVQADFVRYSNIPIALGDECNAKSVAEGAGPATQGDCTLEPTRMAESEAAINQASAAATQLPDLLEKAAVGDPETCAKAVGQYVKQENRLRSAYLKFKRADRAAGYPEAQTNVTVAKAEVAYRRLLVDGSLQRSQVNQFAVLVGCLPAANWAISVDDAVLRLAAVYKYSTARSVFLLSNALSSYCYALVGGTYQNGSNDETTVKTCAARNADPDLMRAARREMDVAYGDLVASGSWGDLSAKCRLSVKSVFKLSDDLFAFRADWDAALANNADAGVFDSLSARFKAIDYAKWVRLDPAVVRCLTPVSSPPA